MAYDFDWDGATIAIGDDEAQTFVLPLDPTGNQQGVEAPGFLAALTDFIQFGVFNGNWRLGPPDPSLPIDVASSTSGSNFLPGWRFVQSSNTAITAKQVRDTSSPSGSNLRFTFAAGASSDAAYIEQYLDIGGSGFSQIGDIVRGAGKLVSGANVAARLRAQYLTVDGSLVGMPAESVTGQFADGASLDWQFNYAAAAPPAGNAARLRLRLEAYRLSGSGAASLDITDVRRDAGKPFIVVPDLDGVTLAGQVYQSVGRMIAGGGGAASSVINYQLVPLEFVYVDIPANTTKELLPSDNNMALSGVPRVVLPWVADIVGMSYRLSGAPTAGTINLQATVGGSNVWSPFGALGTGAATGDAAEQSIGNDTVSAGSGIGVQVVTNAAYTPATRDIHVVLWLAVSGFTG